HSTLGQCAETVGRGTPRKRLYKARSDHVPLSMIPVRSGAVSTSQLAVPLTWSPFQQLQTYETAEDLISPSRRYQAAASAFPSMVFHGVPPIVTRKTSCWSQTPVVQPRNRVAG